MAEKENGMQASGAVHREIQSEYCLGVIGGMGPMATAVFMEDVIRHTPARRDQEHLPMRICHLPYIPDRTAYLLGQTGENPLPYITEAAESLVWQGVTEIAIPCVTAHSFYGEITKGLAVPLLDGVTETADALSKQHCRRVGVMATTGTVQAGLFTGAFAQRGITCVYPDETRQGEVMSLIYDDIKANRPVDRAHLDDVVSHLYAKGADTILLGCTELSLLPAEYLPQGAADVLDILAQTCVAHFMAHPRPHR